MKRLLLSVCIPALTFFGFSLKAHAAETHSAPAFMNAEGEGIFPKGKTNDAYAQYFNGTSYLQALSTEGVAIANVTFEPGCRNFWHIHRKGGQILLVTGGRGWYQQWEKPARALKPGDVAVDALQTKDGRYESNYIQSSPENIFYYAKPKHDN